MDLHKREQCRVFWQWLSQICNVFWSIQWHRRLQGCHANFKLWLERGSILREHLFWCKLCIPLYSYSCQKTHNDKFIWIINCAHCLAFSSIKFVFNPYSNYYVFIRYIELMYLSTLLCTYISKLLAAVSEGKISNVKFILYLHSYIVL